MILKSFNPMKIRKTFAREMLYYGRIIAKMNMKIYVSKEEIKVKNKILAFVLAVVTLLASVSWWDFGEANAEDSGTITAKDYGVTIDFDNIDVTKLDEAGYVSTKFKDGEAVSGEVDQLVSKHWFSGSSDDTPYGSVEEATVKAKNSGLKTKDTEIDDTRTVMYTPYSYEDFQVSAEIYYGAFTGIIVGEKNVYPVEGGNSSSVALFFNNGRVHIVGAVEKDTAKIMRGTSAQVADNDSALGYKIFNNGSGDTISANAGGTYTVNVKKTGNTLLVWISGGTGLMTIKLADSYENGWIGIQSKCYDGDGGGFKALGISKVHATESHSLDNADMSELDDMGYSASVGGTLKKDSVGDVFFSGATNGTLTTNNEGMKGLATGGSVSALNIPYVYDNFRLEAEVYHGQLIGVAVGDAASYPRSSDNKMISVFYNIHVNNVMLQWEGAYQGTAVREGGSSGAAANQYKPTLDGNKLSGDKETVYTIVLEVRDGVMKMWMKGYDGYITANVADTYTTGKISLIARKAVADGGGIKSYTITNLDAGDTADFDNVYLQNLDAAGYIGADCADTTLTDKSVSDVWFSGESGYSESEANKNNGLKPRDTDSSIDLLNIPNVYENFRLETTMYLGQVLGVAIGKEGVKPTASSGGDNGVITIYTNANFIELTGSIDKTSASLSAGTSVLSNGNLYHYIPLEHTAEWNTERTLVVELQNGILSVWMEGYEGVLRVRVTDAYDTENIALIARRNNTSGNPGGGLKSYTIEKLPVTNNIGMTVDMGGYTDFDLVDTTTLDEKGFTVTKFNTDGTIIATDGTVTGNMFAGETGISASGAVAYNVSASNNGLKTNQFGTDPVQTVLNTPYTVANGYEDFSASLEVYWGSGTGIIIGAKNVLPSKTNQSIMIYFNANQVQLSGGGIDPSSVVLTGSDGMWNVSYDPTFIYKPGTEFSPQSSVGTVYDLNVELKDGTVTVWVEGYDSVLSFNTTSDFTHDTVALVSRCYDGHGGGLKNFTIEALNEDIVKEYDAADFAALRSSEGHSAPAFKNYLFAGWFTDKTCAKESAIASDVLTVEEGTTVYAKFVPRYILTVKAQVSTNLLDDAITEDDAEGAIRFVTTLDTENYAESGIQIVYDKDGDGVEDVEIFAEDQVYDSITAFGTNTYLPTDLCDGANYFKTCTLKWIASEDYDVQYKATAFWKTLDGTEVKGDTVVKTINQGISIDKLSGKTALFVGDSIMDGANYNHVYEESIQYKGWYDRLARYYGMVTEEVAQKGWALTNYETSHRSQIVTQLDMAKKTSYDFVVLEGGVNDVRIDQDNADIVIDWGTIDEDPAKEDYGDSTIAGAMQNLIIATQEKFPEAKIVYIINHYYGATDENMQKYVAMVKDACRVHGIEYADLSDTEAYPSLEPLTQQSSEYISDNLHPKAAGYELSTPVIADCLRKVMMEVQVEALQKEDTP